MKRLLCFLIILSFNPRLHAQTAFTESEVWSAGADTGIAEHFVFGLTVAKNGVVLAFSEGRIRPGDAAPHHIVLKRSLDKGKTWLPSQILAESKENECYGNPTAVTDSKTGDIILFYAQNFNNERTDVFFISSKDNGITWGKPLKVTSLFDSDALKRPFHLPGPGHGIALKNGRLLVQVWHRFSVRLPMNERKYGVSVIYSDDHGRTWKAGGYIPHDDAFPANESRIVELSNGDVLLDSRYATGKDDCKRIQSYSKDGGLTWSEGSFSSMTPFTPIDAGLNSINVDGKAHLLFTHPAGPLRNNLVINVSSDNGKTWTDGKLISPGPVNYSDIAILPDNTILVLYGKGIPKYVVAARFSLKWAGNDSKAQ